MPHSQSGAKASPYPPFERDEAFEELSALIRSDRPPIALIGAGASVKSGYPNWRELLELLQKAAGKKARAAQWKKNLDDINDAPWTAEVFSQDMPKGALKRLLRNEFKGKGTVQEPHLSLAKMGFAHYLTTNFDPCIENALDLAGRPKRAISWHDTGTVSDFLINLSNRRHDTRVVYLHGRYDDSADNIVLTESSYVSRYVANDDARRKLMAIFMTHPVVFVGFSMNDPDLASIMREVTARLQSEKPCHYAIMAYKTKSDRDATRARMEGKFGVRPIFFSRTPSQAGGDDYSNLVPLLEALAGKGLSATKTQKSFRVQPAEFDPEDPHKGQFGGKSERRGRRVVVRQIGKNKGQSKLNLRLSVETLNQKKITGKVRFYLHPSFDRTTFTYEAHDGIAECEITAYGAFTFGVEIKNERLRLESDLATLPHLPIWFRRR